MRAIGEVVLCGIAALSTGNIASAWLTAFLGPAMGMSHMDLAVCAQSRTSETSLPCPSNDGDYLWRRSGMSSTHSNRIHGRQGAAGHPRRPPQHAHGDVAQSRCSGSAIALEQAPLGFFPRGVLPGPTEAQSAATCIHSFRRPLPCVLLTRWLS